MATPSSEDRQPPYQTSLERYPEYLRAIGTVTVEMTNLEVMFGDLLGTVLSLSDDTAHAIYFSLYQPVQDSRF
jgi:hypothetical protein